MDGHDNHKILTVVYSLGIGGTERSAQVFALGYKKLGLDSRVLTLNDGIRRGELEESGIPIWVGIQESLKEISTWAPEFVHVHSHDLPSDIVYQVKEAIVDCVLVETNVFGLRSDWHELLDFSYQLSRHCLRRFNGMLMPQDKRNGVIIANPILTSSFYPEGLDAINEFKRDLNIDSNATLLGRLGQPIEMKWSPVLIDIFDKLKKEDESLNLLLIGAPKSVVERAKKSPYADHIHRLQRIESDAELRLVYSAIDIFVHISEYGESFGYVNVEALLCGTPVVSLQTPWADNSQAEIIGHEVGGLMANSFQGFENAIFTLLKDKNKRLALGTKGRQSIIKRFDYLNLVNQSLSYLNRQKGITPVDENISETLRLLNYAVDKPKMFTNTFVRFNKLLFITRLTTGYNTLSEFMTYFKSLILKKIRV